MLLIENASDIAQHADVVEHACYGTGFREHRSLITQASDIYRTPRYAAPTAHVFHQYRRTPFLVLLVLGAPAGFNHPRSAQPRLWST